MKPLNIRIELLIHFNLIGIELDFGAVKQRFLACKAGYYLIDSLYEFASGRVGRTLLRVKSSCHVRLPAKISPYL